MPSAKASPLQAIRKQAAAHHRSLAVSLGALFSATQHAAAKTQQKASAGSAFSALERKNEEVRLGFKRTYRDLDGNTHNVPSEAPRKRVKKVAVSEPPSGWYGPYLTCWQPKKTTKPKKKAPAKPAVPAIESWRPAGGDKLTKSRKPEKLTDTLGLARIATWRIPAFQEAAEKLIEQHGFDFEEITTSEILHGGESVTDVCVKFRSELVAEFVKEKLEGEMIEGRKLQIKYA